MEQTFWTVQVDRGYGWVTLFESKVPHFAKVKYEEIKARLSSGNGIRLIRPDQRTEFIEHLPKASRG